MSCGQSLPQNNRKAYLLNALPGGLIPPEGIEISILPCQAGEVNRAAPDSAIGHAETAALVSGLLGQTVPMARITVPTLERGDVHFVALYQGPRLPEGATTLPDGATLRLYKLEAF